MTVDELKEILRTIENIERMLTLSPRISNADREAYESHIEKLLAMRLDGPGLSSTEE